MSEQISITVPPEAEAIIKRNRDKAGLSAALARAMDQQNQFAVSRIQRAYMSFSKGGPATMEGTRVQSNRLRSSVRASRSAVTANGIESAIGSNVIYALRLEFGYTGTITVSAHDRKHVSGKGKNKRTMTLAIQSYDQHVDQPGRHMFSKGINDQKGSYSQAFLQAVLNFQKGQNQ